MTVESYCIATKPICPNCAKELGGAAGIDSVAPKLGDLSICAYCGVLLTFTGEMRLRPMTGEEILGLPDDLRRKIELYQESLGETRSKRVRLN